MLIDTHVHLNSDKLYAELDDVINRAKAVGVEKMIVVGFDQLTNKRAIEIAEKYSFVYATVGFHPTDAKDVTNDDFVLLEEQLKHDKVVAVGECGLDFYWDKEHIERQIEIFKKQIEISLRINKPLVIHMRDASEATYNVLSDYTGLKGVMHCYSGSAEMAPLFTEMGLMISLGGPVTFKNGHKPKKVASEIDLKDLLIETDSPYLSPHPFRGKTNEPARVKLVCEEIARIKDVPYKEVAQITSQNAIELFKL